TGTTRGADESLAGGAALDGGAVAGGVGTRRTALAAIAALRARPARAGVPPAAAAAARRAAYCDRWRRPVPADAPGPPASRTGCVVHGHRPERGEHRHCSPAGAG